QRLFLDALDNGRGVCINESGVEIVLGRGHGDPAIGHLALCAGGRHAQGVAADLGIGVVRLVGRFGIVAPFMRGHGALERVE
ncbi:hypothetical protein DF186_21980, partial [Enterococcus hirae]